MLFSVVIPTYNRLPLLKQALESVWAQTFSDYEVIMIDDGSTDDTEAFAHSLGERIRFFKQANRGPGAARNLGIKHARGDYVAFLDSDDVWFPWTLSTYAKAIGENKSPSLISGNWLSLQKEPGQLSFGQRELRMQTFHNLLAACTGTTPPIGGTPSIAVRTQCLRKVGGFCEMLINGEDTDLWLRLGVEPWFVRIYTPPVYAQRIHNNNITLTIERAISGVEYQIRQEMEGAYPGEATDRIKRIRMLAASARNVSLHCQKNGHLGKGWAFYVKTFPWQMALFRIRYLLAFPLLTVPAMFWLGRRK